MIARGNLFAQDEWRTVGGAGVGGAGWCAAWVARVGLGLGCSAAWVAGCCAAWVALVAVPHGWLGLVIFQPPWPML